jgi:hypothetical protein
MFSVVVMLAWTTRGDLSSTMSSWSLPSACDENSIVSEFNERAYLDFRRIPGESRKYESKEPMRARHTRKICSRERSVWRGETVASSATP